jgi:hypothetical protein
VRLPSGVYKLTDYITPDTNQALSYAQWIGEKSLIVASAGAVIFGGVGYDVSFKDLILRGGAVGLSIKTLNANSAIVSVDGCEFHDQTTACIRDDATSQSTQLNIRDTKFRQASAGYVLQLTSTNYAYLNQCWVQSSGPVVFYVGPECIFTARDCLGVPEGALAAPGGRWCDNYFQAHFDNFRFGGESGGGTFIRNYAAAATVAPIAPTGISIKNCPAFASGVYAIEFYALPNFIEVYNNHGLNGTVLGFYFDAGLTNANFRDFQEFGTVTIRNNFSSSGTTNSAPIELIANISSANGDLGLKVFTAARARSGDIPIPLRARFKETEIKGSGENSTAVFSSVTSVNVTAANVSDGYLVSRLQLTASADEGARDYQHTTYLNPTVLTYGRVYTLNVVVDVTAEWVRAGIKVCGAEMKFGLTEGRHVLSVPFVYLNNTGAPSATFDTVVLSAKFRKSGDVLAWGRHILVEGIAKTADVLTVEGTAAPAGFTNGIGANTGYFRGDLNYRTNVAAAGAPGDVCVTEGAPGTWKAMGSIAA